MFHSHAVNLRFGNAIIASITEQLVVRWSGHLDRLDHMSDIRVLRQSIDSTIPWNLEGSSTEWACNWRPRMIAGKVRDVGLEAIRTEGVEAGQHSWDDWRSLVPGVERPSAVRTFVGVHAVYRCWSTHGLPRWRQFSYILLRTGPWLRNA